MLLRIDHIDFKVKDMEAFVNDLLKIGMVEKRRSPRPRLSVELALPGENQVVFEVHQLKEGAGQEIHHIAFKSDGNDLERLKRNGFSLDRKSSHQGYGENREHFFRHQRFYLAIDGLAGVRYGNWFQGFFKEDDASLGNSRSVRSIPAPMWQTA
jgi:hypothetical protein